VSYPKAGDSRSLREKRERFLGLSWWRFGITGVKHLKPLGGRQRTRSERGHGHNPCIAKENCSLVTSRTFTLPILRQTLQLSREEGEPLGRSHSDIQCENLTAFFSMAIQESSVLLPLFLLGRHGFHPQGRWRSCPSGPCTCALQHLLPIFQGSEEPTPLTPPPGRPSGALPHQRPPICTW
jgi:hypothetical protein